MTYRIPPSRRDGVRRALDTLRAARRVVLTTHVNADGDGAGSEVALTAWLRSRGTEAWIVNPTPYPEAFRFLVEEDHWVVDAGTDRATELCAGADLAVVLDTGEVSRIGRVKPLVDPLQRLVIDHHQPVDDPITGVSFRDAKACATGELVYDLVAAAGGPWPDPVVQGLYVAIVTDTGSFRFANTTPACHRIAADLVERGADPESTWRRVYGAFPMRRFELLREALALLDVDRDGHVAWMTVPRESYVRMGAGPDDLEGLVDYPRSVEGVEVALLFRQTAAGATKVSFRSNGAVDVNALARRFGGGGHTKASGALVKRPLEEVRLEVVAAAAEAVRKAGLGGG